MPCEARAQPCTLLTQSINEGNRKVAIAERCQLLFGSGTLQQPPLHFKLLLLPSLQHLLLSIYHPSSAHRTCIMCHVIWHDLADEVHEVIHWLLLVMPGLVLFCYFSCKVPHVLMTPGVKVAGVALRVSEKNMSELQGLVMASANRNPHLWLECADA